MRHPLVLRTAHGIHAQSGYLMAIILMAFFMILTLLGYSAFRQTQSEGKLLGDQFRGRQFRYAARGAADFAIRNYEAGRFQGGALPVSIHGTTPTAAVTVPSASEQSTYNANRLLTVTVAGQPLVRVYFFECNAGYSQSAVYLVGSSTITPSGSGNCLSITHVQNLPPVNLNALNNLAQNQNRVYNSNLTISTNNFPSSSFFQSGSTPWVIWVNGSLTVNRTAYGIYAVSGNVTISNTTVHGVIFLRSRGTTLTMSGGTINGGVVGYGSVQGSGTINYNSTFMSAFNGYASNTPVVNAVNETFILN